MKSKSQGELNDIIQTVYEFRESKYWHYIKNHLYELLSDKDRYIDTFKYIGMNMKNSDEYNKTLRDIYWIKRMIGINEEIIKHNTGIVEKILEKLKLNKIYEEAIKAKQSFVSLFESKEN